jgi:hypothetical protein
LTRTPFAACPKLLQKRVPDDPFAKRLTSQGAAHRRRILELRHKVLVKLCDVFGESFATEEGLIRSLGRRGYAVAATVKYED